MFSRIGVNQEYLILAILIILVVLIVFNMIMIVKYNELNERYAKFMRGNNGKSLEDRILERFKDIDTVKEKTNELIMRVGELESARDTSFKKLAVVRYDAYKEMGGKLSYSICLLNDDDDGFIMTGMHNRDSCYTYIKEVIKGNTYVLLSDEEKNVLDEAINSTDTIRSI